MAGKEALVKNAVNIPLAGKEDAIKIVLNKELIEKYQKNIVARSNKILSFVGKYYNSFTSKVAKLINPFVVKFINPMNAFMGEPKIEKLNSDIVDTYIKSTVLSNVFSKFLPTFRIERIAKGQQELYSKLADKMESERDMDVFNEDTIKNLRRKNLKSNIISGISLISGLTFLPYFSTKVTEKISNKFNLTNKTKSIITPCVGAVMQKGMSIFTSYMYRPDSNKVVSKYVKAASFTNV